MRTHASLDHVMQSKEYGVEQGVVLCRLNVENDGRHSPRVRYRLQIYEIIINHIIESRMVTNSCVQKSF